MSLLGGLFNQFKKGLKRTQELVLAPMGRLLGLRRLDEAQLEELEDLSLDAGIQCTRRFIGDQQLWPVTECDGDGNPLAHAA